MMILIKGTPQNGTPNFGKAPYISSSWFWKPRLCLGVGSDRWTLTFVGHYDYKNRAHFDGAGYWLELGFGV